MDNKRKSVCKELSWTDFRDICIDRTSKTTTQQSGGSCDGSDLNQAPLAQLEAVRTIKGSEHQKWKYMSPQCSPVSETALLFLKATRLGPLVLPLTAVLE